MVELLCYLQMQVTASSNFPIEHLKENSHSFIGNRAHTVSKSLMHTSKGEVDYPALGPAIEAARRSMAPFGGKMSIFQFTLSAVEASVPESRGGQRRRGRGFEDGALGGSEFLKVRFYILF
jgi:hypothetical protein